jgi:hypothetical protein
MSDPPTTFRRKGRKSDESFPEPLCIANQRVIDAEHKRIGIPRMGAAGGER